MGEDELEDRLGEKVACGNREDKNLVCIEVFGNILRELAVLASTLPTQQAMEISGQYGLGRTGSVTATEAMSRFSRNCSMHEQANMDHLRHLGSLDKSSTCEGGTLSSVLPSFSGMSWNTIAPLELLLAEPMLPRAETFSCSGDDGGGVVSILRHQEEALEGLQVLTKV